MGPWWYGLGAIVWRIMTGIKELGAVNNIFTSDEEQDVERPPAAPH